MRGGGGGGQEGREREGDKREGEKWGRGTEITDLGSSRHIFAQVLELATAFSTYKRRNNNMPIYRVTPFYFFFSFLPNGNYKKSKTKK